MNTALVKAWRISKKNSSMALGTALLLLVMGLLAAILFVIVFNYHEEYETLGELLRIPALVILGCFICCTASWAILLLCRYCDIKLNAGLPQANKHL